MSDIHIRQGTKADAPLILDFIQALADYEKEPDAVKATVADIENNLFNPANTTDAIIAEIDDRPVGFAVTFLNFSTWLGKSGLFLEDLFVDPAYRGKGVGKALLKHLAQHAVEQGYERFEWNVLTWNEPALKFYQSIGAKPQDEWIGYRMTGEAIRAFAES